MIEARVTALVARDGRWALLNGEGRTIAEADVVCLAAGADPHLAGSLNLDFVPVRGQVSWAHGLALDHARAWGGYVAPMDGGVLFGATHDRGRRDTAVSDEDHARNLAALAQGLPVLAQQAAGRPLEGRAAIRATTFDRMPTAGPAGAPGLFILGGLGSRGFTTAPLLAEHVATIALGSPSPLPLHLRTLVETFRSRKTPGAPTAC
jgi:tRNA 5-methylaminomethyl-2-thiouridine biosynthesis bifunctional protein